MPELESTPEFGRTFFVSCFPTMNLFDDEPQALTVGELALHIRRIIEVDPILSDIAVEGEISNFKAHGSGHLYLTLKDEEASLRVVMWKSSAGRLNFRPSNGDRVIATGRVEFYGARGELSFICDSLRFAGHGAAMEALERIRAELAAEGLFDTSRKRALPFMPRVIGLITSPTGAVAHDVLSILRRRFPLARIVFIPAKVQGMDAAADLVRALSWAAALEELDVIIIGRGGGSAEDLWAFNDEDLARAAASFPRPLISAVGHETDYTILDFVADLRAPTPSAAAELVAPDIRDLAATIESLRGRAARAVEDDVTGWRERLDFLRARRVLTHPRDRLVLQRERVGELHRRIGLGARNRVKIERRLLASRHAELSALDPRRVLDRGYALVEKTDGKLLRAASETARGDELKIILRDGAIAARVE